GGSNDLPIVDLDNAIFSRTQIIRFDNFMVRFDTSTGELFRFRGTPQGPNANGTFRSIARAVDDPTSGFLEIQQFENATFLVDVVTGDTWILRRSGANNAAWVLVDTIG
ncbi:MAG: hypothetical protein L0Y44_02165, partial [Phycisphaerales bacterium]|nr:hypothetical protein [Phycisphaerales bacterium]MCI0629441.1 hypothetical protein [Phycisphaerales bacterium]